MTAPSTISLQVNLPDYHKEGMDGVTRSFTIWKYLSQKARIKKTSGTKVVWPVLAGTNKTYVAEGFALIDDTFVPELHDVQAELKRSIHVTSEAVSGQTLADNKSDTQLVDIWNETVPRMYRSHLTQSSTSLSWWFFHGDGTLSGDTGTGIYRGGNAVPTYGLASFLPTTSTAATTSQEASYSGNPTYAGLPLGTNLSVDNPVADAWTGRQINVTYDWNSDTTTGNAASGWNLGTIPEILEYAILKCTRDPSDPTEVPDVLYLGETWYRTMKSFMRRNQTLNLEVGTNPSGKINALGIDNDGHINFSGVTVLFDRNVADETGFLVNWDHVAFDWCQLPMMGQKAWKGSTNKGMQGFDQFTEFYSDWDMRRVLGALTLSIQDYSQFRFNPSRFARIHAYA